MTKVKSQVKSDGRHVWWSVTAFNDECELLENMRTGVISLPPEFRELHGGLEACPHTGRTHFQGAIRTRQLRIMSLKKILPTAHLEGAISPPDLKKYALKPATAIDEKTSLVVGYVPAGESLRRIAQELTRYCDTARDAEKPYLLRIADQRNGRLEAIPMMMYWDAVNSILETDPALRANPGQFVRPDAMTIWKNCYRVYLKEATGEIEASITRDPVEEFDAVPPAELNSNVLVYPNGQEPPPPSPVSVRSSGDGRSRRDSRDSQESCESDKEEE